MSAQPLEIELRTTASRVAEALREELLAGLHAPGAPLRDNELAARTGVSRPTVREALAELARDGLVVHSLHRGMEVARLDLADVRDLYATRRVIEQASLAALMRPRVRDVSALEAALAAMARAVAQARERAVVEADVAFHAALVRAAGVRRLERAHHAAMLELRLVLSVSDRARRELDGLLESHRRLLERIASGSAREAARELDGHLAAAEQRVVEVLAAATTSAGTPQPTAPPTSAARARSSR